VRVNPKFYRPAEVELLIGDASLALQDLGWNAPTGVQDLCRLMVEADLRRTRNGFSW
jgi:GDPmannose 4,6-dehydratase